MKLSSTATGASFTLAKSIVTVPSFAEVRPPSSLTVYRKLPCPTKSSSGSKVKLPSLFNITEPLTAELVTSVAVKFVASSSESTSVSFVSTFPA